MFLAGNTIIRPCKPSFRFVEFSTNTYLRTLRDYKTIKSIHIMLRMSLIGMAAQRQEPLIIVSIPDRHRVSVTVPEHFSTWHSWFLHSTIAMFSLFHAVFPSLLCCGPGWILLFASVLRQGAALCSINMYFVLNVDACIVHFSHENESLRGIQPAWASSGSTAAAVRTTL